VLFVVVLVIVPQLNILRGKSKSDRRELDSFTDYLDQAIKEFQESEQTNNPKQLKLLVHHSIKYMLI
jgi:hypothetical protein